MNIRNLLRSFFATRQKSLLHVKVSVVLLCLILSCTTTKQEDPFRMDNLIPWSIVAFDSKERNYIERIEMLKDLNFTKFAFAGREQHLVTMEQELKLAKSEGIEITSVWLWLNDDLDQPGKLKPLNERIFKTLKDQKLETQIWVGFHQNYFEGLSDEDALTKALKIFSYVAERAEAQGCRVGLYNHGGWSGEPENMLEIIESLPQYNLGIVYNFHHGHTQIDRYPQLLDKMMPYLWCVNLNGMNKDGPKILGIGKGTEEKRMIQLLLDKNYAGPFGILGHEKEADTKEILIANLNGLQNLFNEN